MTQSSPSPYAFFKTSRTIKAGAVACVLGLGGFMIWAGLAPLAEGVVVYGSVAVENDRKTVQHLEGGIIQDILVLDGDMVAAGAPLMVLADVGVSAGRDQILQELVTAQMGVDRLEALLAGRTRVSFKDHGEGLLAGDVIDDIKARQLNLFKQQRDKLSADISVLNSRRTGMLERADNFDAQIAGKRRAKALIDEDIARSEALLEQRLIRASELSRLTQDEARLASDITELSSEQSNMRAQASELSQQIVQTRANFREAVSGDLVQQRADVLSHSERLISAQDVVNRTTIYAPQSGEILNLAFSTPGGVVRPGETILEIVPDRTALIAVVELKPSDRDAVYEGLAVEARLSGLKSWNSPLLEGTITDISADLKVSPDGRYSYYEASVKLGAEKLGKLETPLLPGMPVEAFVFSGQKRTFLDYVIEPLGATFRRGARE